MYAVGGVTTATVASQIDAFLADKTAQPYWPRAVLVNLGSNDFQGIEAGTITQAAWEADMGHILDALHTAWPDAVIFLMRPVWYRYETSFNPYNDTWIPSVLSPRASWAFEGPDERTFLVEGVNMTDGTHPNASGYSETENQWLTAILALF